MPSRPSDSPLLSRLDRPDRKQSVAYRKSKKLEKGVAKRTRGYVTTGSGNKNEKGDVRVRGVARIEHKATQKKSFSITREMLDKIVNAAIGHGEIPAVVVDFLDARGNSIQEVAVIPLSDLLELINDRTAK
jgi:hypothetical protein